MKNTFFKKTLIISLLFLIVVPAFVLARDTELEDRLKGRILLQVEDRGEAWYLEPDSRERVYLGRPDDAFRLMREFGLGITNSNLAQIATTNEVAKNNSLARRLAGKILLQVENNGEAWYVNPVTLKRHYLKRPSDAFRIMRELGLGVKNTDLAKLAVKPNYGISVRQIELTLYAQNTSTPIGEAELNDLGKQTKIEIKINNPSENIEQPTHIHAGSCENLGAIVYPLNNLINGKSETIVNESLDSILTGLPLVLNIHKSASEMNVSLACGNLHKNFQSKN